MKVHLVTLGCPKNEVDSAGMAGVLRRAGHVLVERPVAADVLVVNTCGFIAPAREESLEVLRELARGKRPGQFLVAAGCMAGRYGGLLRAVSGVDALLETDRWRQIAHLVSQLACERVTAIPEEELPEGIGLSASHGGSAYLKIADGCDAHCAFCTIPQIKGPYRSVPRGQLVAEARALIEQGVREIILVAQDTTSYGRDRGEEQGLAGLLEALLQAVPELPWLRIMYTYPSRVSPRLIEVIADHPQICPYLDIPLQHAHPATLRRMGRPTDVERIRALLRRLRETVPDLVLRTTLIVGYPGETEEEFAALRAFLQEQAFERVGVFPFFCEEGTPAARLPQQVPQEVALRRRDELMRLQQGIARRWGEQQIGRTVDVLVEGINEDGIVVGRTRWDAPEVDGLVLAQTDPEDPSRSKRRRRAAEGQGAVRVGEIVPVRITSASAYDLWGTIEP